MDNEKVIDRLINAENFRMNAECLKDKKLSEHCTFKIGGIAKYIVYPKNREIFISIIDYLVINGIKHCVLGNASNILFADEGYDGVIIFTSKFDNIYVDCSNDILYAECGASLTLAAVAAQKNGLAGLEFAYGIPGTMGGAVYMNAGAYDCEMKDVVLKSEYYDPYESAVKILEGSRHDFKYRSSFYSGKDMVILNASLKLKKENKETIKTKMDNLMLCRMEKQPLNYPNAGSTFKRYPGYYTAKLIDEAGLKGYMAGGAQVSEKHAGFIINKGGASASDVLKLIDIIKNKIFELYNINIECEIKYIR